MSEDRIDLKWDTEADVGFFQFLITDYIFYKFFHELNKFNFVCVLLSIIVDFNYNFMNEYVTALIVGLFKLVKWNMKRSNQLFQLVSETFKTKIL